jgi:hypothetical protein
MFAAASAIMPRSVERESSSPTQLADPDAGSAQSFKVCCLRLERGEVDICFVHEPAIAEAQLRSGHRFCNA